jgi:hypothetical protein
MPFNLNKVQSLDIKIEDIVAVRCKDCKCTVPIEEAQYDFPEILDFNPSFYCKKCATAKNANQPSNL